MPPFIGTFAQLGTLADPTSWLLAGYIFTWQFPHFYGILYDHKEDYKKVGFVMTSNQDPTGEKTAFQQILGCKILNTFIPCMMSSTGVLHPIFIAPFLVA